VATDNYTPYQRFRAAGLLLPFFLGIAAPIVIYRTLQLFGTKETAITLIVAALVLGAAAAYASSRIGGRSWAIAGLMYAGIPIGTFIDVMVDSFLFSNDRNLFPLEIVMWWIVGAFPVALGVNFAHSPSGKGIGSTKQ